MIESASPQAVARAAVHCDELLARAATPVDLEIEFAHFVRKLVDQVGPLVCGLCDNRDMIASVAQSGAKTASDWLAAIDADALHAFHAAGNDRSGVLVSSPIGELVAQFDRILGGTGVVDKDCRTLPASAARFARQFDDVMADALRQAGDRRDITVAGNGTSAHEIAPFGAADRVWTATIDVRIAGAKAGWSIHIAACEGMIAEIVGTRAVSPASGRTIGQRGLGGSAIAEIAMPLRAVLVDVPMSIASLANLTAGSIIPVAVHRNVPLMIGNTTVAHGTVGELDDRVALELTQISISGE